MCIADRSLSRLRGSPLPGADCLGRCLAWEELSIRLRSLRPFVSRGRVCPDGCCCGGFAAGALLGLAVPPGFGLGAWPASRVDRFILPVVAAAAMPPVRIWVGCAAWVEAGGLGPSLALTCVSGCALIWALRRLRLQGRRPACSQWEGDAGLSACCAVRRHLNKLTAVYWGHHLTSLYKTQCKGEIV